MGLGPQLVCNLLELRRADKLPTEGRVAEIGAQQLSNAFLRARNELNELYSLFGKEPVELGGPFVNQMVSGVEQMPETSPSSRVFWESLGYEYTAFEFGGHRDVLSLDLNQDLVPQDLRSSFDLLVNSGTTEHVANQDNAFRIVHDLTKPGGLIIHDVPAGGMMTHGMFGYNMQFFWVLCRDNDYEVLDLGLVYCGSAPIHPDVIDSNSRMARFATHFDKRYALPISPELDVPIFMIRATLRKASDRPYSTPLDLPEELLRPHHDE